MTSSRESGGANHVRVGRQSALGSVRRIILLTCLAVSFSAALPPLASAASVRADFNGDGTSDLAVGAPGEDQTTLDPDLNETVGGEDVGAVNVFYGSPGGLQAAPQFSNDQFFQHEVGGQLEAGDHFGGSLAAGDFNGDGRADLAIGTALETLGPNNEHTNAGAINIVYGSPNGLTTTGARQFSQQDAGGTVEAIERFGISLTAADFNGDGKADLAAGALREDLGSTGENAGAVNILYGSGTGLVTTGARQFDQSQAGGNVEAEDLFGYALAAGDFNRDKSADLAVGVPFEDVGSGPANSAGVVNILYGSKAGLRPHFAQQFDQEEAGGKVETFDGFGDSLAAGDFNGDKRVDLAVGAGPEDVNSLQNAGAVSILYSSKTGKKRLTADGAFEFTQKRAGGKVRPEEVFGGSLAAGDFNSDKKADLAVAATGDGGAFVPPVFRAGVVSILYGLVKGFKPLRNPQEFGQQDMTGPVAENEVNGFAPAGEGEFSDGFGSALTVGDFNGDGTTDLAAGTPEEDVLGTDTNGNPVEPRADAGVVNVLYGSAPGLTTTRPRMWDQDSAGGNVEAGDRFGQALGG